MSSMEKSIKVKHPIYGEGMIIEDSPLTGKHAALVRFKDVFSGDRHYKLVARANLTTIRGDTK